MGSVESHSSESTSESLPTRQERQGTLEIDQQSLLASAAEIVARQRLQEQLEVSVSPSVDHPNPEPSVEPGPSSSSSAASSRNGEFTRNRPRRSTQIANQTQTAARRSHFSTIGELLEDLLGNNELRLDNWWHTAHRNLNMYENADDSSSSEDEFMEAQVCQPRFCDRGIFTISQEEQLQKSYFDLINDISLRCGYCDKFLQASTIEDSNDKDQTTSSSTSSPAKTPVASIPSLLKSRELGLCRSSASPASRVPASFTSRPYTGSLTKGQKVLLNNQFTPNQRRRVGMVTSKTFCVSYIDDGEGLLTASQDHKIRLYRRKGPRRKFEKSRDIEVPYVGWSILDVCVSPDGRDVVYSTWNEAIRQYRIEESCKDDYWHTFRINQRESRFSIFSLRFNNDGSEIVAGSTDGLYIYNRDVNRCVLCIQAHEDDINAVCFGDHSSHIILSGADDGLCKVWDRRTMGDFMDAKPVGVFSGHRDGITYIDSRGDDRYLLTNSKDQTIKIWDLRHFSSEVGVEATKHSVANQRWDYRWQCTPDDVYKVTNLPGDSSVLTIRGHSVLNTLIRARFSPDHTGKRYVYTGCARGNAIVYDLYSGELLKKYPGHKSVVRDCMWHPNENEIVTASWDGETSLWKYDERATRNIHPDGGYNTGDEDSCDENYEQVKHHLLRNRKICGWREPRRKCVPSGPLPRMGLKVAKVEPLLEDDSSDDDETTQPATYAAAAKKARLNGNNRRNQLS